MNLYRNSEASECLGQELENVKRRVADRDYGCAEITDDAGSWPADAARHRFFKVEVAMPDGARKNREEPLALHPKIMVYFTSARADSPSHRHAGKFPAEGEAQSSPLLFLKT